jgi:predicted amidohydrolase YtcJ
LVGSTREVRARGAGAPEFDCAGRVVVPGLIDGHAHLEMTCCALTHQLSCPIPPFDSLAGIVAALSERAESTPPGQWIVVRSSFGLQWKVAEGRLLNRHELDAVSTEHPLAVLSGLHVAMLNTRALHELGIWDEVDNPPRGIVIHREESGAPSGIATEIWDRLPAFSVEQVKEALRRQYHDLFLAKGVTTIHNLPYSAQDITAVQELQTSGELPVRLRFYYHVPHQLALPDLLAMGLRPGFGNDRLRYGGVKLFVDGIGSDGLGNALWDVKWTPEELNELVSSAHAAGQQLWMHVLRVESLRMGADAIEAALREHPRPHRHRLEHSADIIRDTADMHRLRDLGIRVVTTPQFLYSVSRQELGAAGRPPLRDLIDLGFEVIGSSDTTGTVPDGISPLFNIACAVARLPGQPITFEEALKMFTIWAAAGAFEEGDKGSIEPGKFGDFTVLSDDPREIEPDGLFDLKVDATILGGEVVYER